MSGYQGLTDAELDRRIALAQTSPGPYVSPPQPVSVQPLPPIPGARTAPTGGLSHLTDAQLDGAIANADPHMSTAEDMGRSAVTGLERAGTSLLTTPGNLLDAGGNAMLHMLSHGVGHVQDAMGYKGGNPGFPYLGKGVNYGDDNAPIPFSHVNGMANEADLDKPLQEVAGPFHTPQTAPGRYTQRIAEMAPAALGGGGAVTRLANVIIPGLASQGAEDLAPEQYKGAAALAGAMAGGGAVGVGSRMARAPEAAMGNALGNVSADQIAAAQALRQRAAAQGMDLTLPEAVQQVTNNGTGLGRMQRVIEGTKQGQALTAPYFANRPAQVSAATHALADQIAPESTQPGMIGQRAQEAATGALNTARQTVNGIAGPDYAALPGQTMEPERYAELAANPSYRIALDQLRAHPELGALVAGLPDNNLAVINEVKKRLAVGADQAAGTPLAPGDNHLAALRTGAKADVDAAARDASPEYAAANDTVRNLSQQYVEPLRAGPLGAMSKTDQVGSHTQALYPPQPPEGAAQETGQAIRVLGATAPGVAEDLTRQHIINSLNNATKDLQGGQNQYAGAKLAVMLAAHPEQAAALHAGLSALPNGATRAQQMADLLEIMRATGKRQQPGSMTAFNESDLKDLHIAPSATAIGRSLDPLEWGKGIGDVINRWNYQRNVKSITDMMLAPPEETSAVLERARKAAPKNTASMLLPALIQGARP